MGKYDRFLEGAHIATRESEMELSAAHERIRNTQNLALLYFFRYIMSCPFRPYSIIVAELMELQLIIGTKLETAGLCGWSGGTFCSDFMKADTSKLH